MAETMTHSELAGLLRARAVAVSESQIEAAFRDTQSGPELAAWAATHLTEDTLLTLDELELYDTLQRSGHDETLANDSTSPLPVGERELRAALAALERSTATIQKQTDTIRQQQDALAKLAVPSSTSTSARTDAAARHQQRWDAARVDLVADVERRGRDLDERVGDLTLQNRALAQRVQQTVDGLCRSDDTLLASLQKLGWALPVVPNANDEGEQQQQRRIARLRDICLHLIQLGVETIRTKLDRLYLEALASAPEAAGSTGEGDVAALQEELESLFAEILPVAQMSVEQQHLAPALRALSGQTTRNTSHALLALDYVDACLAYLLEHVSLLAGRIDTAAAHHAATESMLATARAELAVPAPTAASRKTAADNYQRRRLSNYGSPVRRRQSQSGTGAGHMRTRSGTVGGSSSMVSAERKAQRRRSSGSGYDSFDTSAASPMDQLLESLSLLLPMDEPEGTASTAAVDTATRINARFLQTTLAERARKADDVAANAQDAFAAAMATPLADARRALAQARASVLAESPFGAVQLVDAEIDGSIAVVADEVRRLRERRAAVDAALGQARKQGSAKRAQMVARWG